MVTESGRPAPPRRLRTHAQALTHAHPRPTRSLTGTQPPLRSRLAERRRRGGGGRRGSPSFAAARRAASPPSLPPSLPHRAVSGRPGHELRRGERGRPSRGTGGGERGRPGGGRERRPQRRRGPEGRLGKRPRRGGGRRRRQTRDPFGVQQRERQRQPPRRGRPHLQDLLPGPRAGEETRGEESAAGERLPPPSPAALSASRTDRLIPSDPTAPSPAPGGGRRRGAGRAGRREPISTGDRAREPPARRRSGGSGLSAAGGGGGEGARASLGCPARWL